MQYYARTIMSPYLFRPSGSATSLLAPGGQPTLESLESCGISQDRVKSPCATTTTALLQAVDKPRSSSNTHIRFFVLTAVVRLPSRCLARCAPSSRPSSRDPFLFASLKLCHNGSLNPLRPLISGWPRAARLLCDCDHTPFNLARGSVRVTTRSRN